jgi:hypothetical protein
MKFMCRLCQHTSVSFALSILLLWVITPTELFALDGAQKVEFLLQTLETSKDYKVRLAAAEELGKIADGTLADWMVRQFRKEDNGAVRLRILYSIAQIPDHRIIPPLIELLRQEFLSDKEFLAIQRILWNFREAIQITAWENALSTAKDSFEKATAAWILGVVAANSSFPLLVAATKTAVGYVRLRAVQGLALYRSSRAIPVCQRLAESDLDPKVRSSASNCVGVLHMASRGSVPPERDHRTNLKLDLYGLEVQSVTPQMFAKYLRRNVNPRELDAVASALSRPTEAEERLDRTIEIVRDEQLMQTLRLDAQMVTQHSVFLVDLEEMRRIVRSEANQIQGCYRELLKREPKARGDISAHFKVMQNGRVADVQTTSQHFGDKTMAACVAKQIQGLQFPRLPINFVSMNYRFSFSLPKDERYEF